MLRSLITAAAALTLAAPVCLADDLTIGDEAPAIDIAHWVKGEAIDAFEDGKVYIVEFWATWCGPCRASMPHISEMQQKYRDYDVRFIGVSDEPLQTVVKFLFEKDRDGMVNNDRTRYTLTTDPDMSVKNDYFKAAGQRGIPAAFIVGKDQRIEWIGHPMKIEAPLDAIVRDAWDRDAFKTEFDRARTAEIAAKKHFDAYRSATAAKDWKAAMAAIDELAKLDPSYESMQVQKFMILANELRDFESAYALAGEIIDASWKDPGTLNQIAWFIVDDPGLEKRDLDLAMMAAVQACVLTEYKDGAILDTLARAHYEKGDLAKALEFQRKAVEHALPQMRGELAKTLKRYEAEAGE